MRSFDCYKQSAFLSPLGIRKLQDKLLNEHVAYCLKASAFYRRLASKHKSLRNKINIGSLKDIPFTDKSALSKYNRDFIAVSNHNIADIVLSSGTTGAPTKIVYTQKDLLRLTYNERQSLLSSGVSPEDRVLLTCTMDRCFVAGLAYYSGALAIGASCIRNGLNSLESHAGIIKLLNPTVIVGVPSFLRKLGIFMNAKGFSLKHAKKLICIGEPLRDQFLKPLALTDQIEKLWGAKAFSTYSSSEIITTFCECQKRCGGHLHPELGIVEIIDEKGNILPPGTPGELVVTPLQIEGMPLLRFRTGDITFIIDEPCSCGRQSLRLGPILGRKKQMLKVKGTTVYPLAVYAALDELKEISDYYLTVYANDKLSDRLCVTVSLREACSVSKIVEALNARLRVSPEVVIASDDDVRRVVYNPALRKPVRFFDKRESL